MTRIGPLPSWIIAIALTGCLQLVRAQNPASAYVPLSVVGSKIGFTTNFTCQSHGIPVSNCIWEREPAPGTNPGKLYLYITSANARPGENIQPGYSYLGDGLEKGECGVAIQTVKEGDNGKWKCTLITSSGLYIGEVDLGILKKPDQPKFDPPALAGLVDSDDNRYRASQPKKITCYSGNGQPQPRFQWFIGEEPLREGLDKIGYVVPNNSDVGYTFQELHNHKFTWRDNGKKLRCVAIHDAFGPDDPREAQVDINILFPPRPARDDVGSHVNVRAEIGTEKILSVNISANPRPTKVEWNVDKKLIREGQSMEGKYEAIVIKEVEPNVWEASLRIQSVEEEDVNKHFLLEVTNDYGVANFDLKVASEATGSGGLSAGGIVLLILGIAALLIIIALVVVYARAQGLLCFKGDDGTASEKERMDGGSTGPGSGEEPPQQKPGLKLTSRLSALYDNLLNKKKDKPVPADEESATATKEKEPGQESSTPVKPGQAPGTPATGVDSKDAKPDDEKKSEDIVYAELDLARSGVGGGGGNGNPEIVVRASDDKTEYAEIVGVVAASTIDEHKRSPSASNKSGGSASDK